MLFFDHQNTSPPLPEALELMHQIERDLWGNRTVPYGLFNEQAAIEKEALETLYSFVDADPNAPFILTSSGTEAVNHVILSAFLEITQQEGKHHYLATTIGEAPVIMGMTRLEERGCQFEMVPLNDEGEITVQAVIDKLTPSTALFSMPAACGVTGIVHPTQEIAAVLKERGVVFHVDVTHLLGRAPFSFKESGADCITFHGEQLGAPRGCGGLFVKPGVPLGPLLVGGNEQGKWRAGNMSLGHLAALSLCAQKASEELLHRTLETGRLCALFEETLCERFPFIEVVLKEKTRLPHITTLLFDRVTSDALLYMLSQKQLYATMGGSYFQQIAFLLQAYGVEERKARTGLSFSFSHTMTEEHIERAVEIISGCLEERAHLSAHLLQEAL